MLMSHNVFHGLSRSHCPRPSRHERNCGSEIAIESFHLQVLLRDVTANEAAPGALKSGALLWKCELNILLSDWRGRFVEDTCVR
jgi:hypothetical protein